MDQIQLYPLGEAALVLAAGEAAQLRLQAVHSAALQREDVVAAILGVGNLTVRFDPLQTNSDQLAFDLKRLFLSSEQTRPCTSRVHELPVRYGGRYGPDLALVAAHAKLSISEVAQRHSSIIYDVLCLGFLPGFPYLAGLPVDLACPRRASPRLQVPAGSVGIGGRQTGIYPCASPGGWQIIGHCDVSLFDEKQSPPSLMQAGDRIRFIAVSVES
ncbi:5-oxoprolinase subunit PxpB [Deefgea chitinilytica]|uniref:5-oxoprolinase subunit PxpB n=1 Tax=Deefgea chitinilytica TaxID=570276 RepID=A0ABS2CB99_9NEIS|nr:5-oxoprolinase subunit PxpB [Deefgea chitinilytica]MBM9888139.1 5-oxoprolinase subunit PxpB [Deefgea sp. CFH1-16]